ncbi:MAG: DUF3455 domain-containing protein [Rhizobacter sp.]|nr:DUF3455 domain-containing protein [Ferruginibacter sp.]
MKIKLFLKCLLAAVLLTGTAGGCSEENSVFYSPSYYIMKSEDLLFDSVIDLPANLPTGNSRVATYYAMGVQKYKSQVKAGTNPILYEWVLAGPKAVLFDAGNKKIGSHGAGPFWELSPADSIFAQQFNPVKAVTPDGSSIPWLQLMPKNGRTPTGIFLNVAYIQRIATTGGKAPTVAPVSLSDTVDVKYTAVYRFSKRNQ